MYIMADVGSRSDASVGRQSSPSTSNVQVKIKQEKLTPPQSPAARSSANSTGDDDGDRKNVGPVKSSNQLLNELFQTFNAIVPDTLFADLSSTPKRKMKKEKKSKKSKKDKKDGGDETGSKRHHKKVKKEKKDKHETTDDKHCRSSSGASQMGIKEEMVVVDAAKTEKRRIECEGGEDGAKRKQIKRERSGSREARERSAKTDHSDSRKKRSSSRTKDKSSADNSRVPAKSTKITIKCLKDSAVFREADRDSKRKASASSSKSHRPHHHRRQSESHASDTSVLSLSDEETYNRECDRYLKHRNESKRRSGRKDDRDLTNRSRDRSRDRPRRGDDRSERGENRFYAGSDRLRDEQRLVL